MIQGAPKKSPPALEALLVTAIKALGDDLSFVLLLPPQVQGLDFGMFKLLSYPAE